MKLDDLAALIGVTREELIEQLKQNDIIELRLIEKKSKQTKDIGGIEILG